MLVFKKLEKAISAVKNNILLYSYDDVQKELELNKLAALKEILYYIKSFSWLTHSRSRQKIKAFLKNNYNYRKTCEELNISLRSLEQSVSYANKMLWDKVGKNTIDLILNSDIEAAMLQFKIGTSTLGISNLFIKGIIELLPDPERDNILSIEQCTEELKLVRQLTKQYIQKVLDSKNREKLAFILYLLVSNDSKYTHERDLVYKYISGTISDAEMLLQSNKSINIFADDY